MLKFLRTSALALAAASASFVAAPERAQAQSYQIDCAILLCLSGGWPASVPCARARAEFIRRITPWPVEPPLQIWRCPMGAAFEVDPSTLNADRIYEILMDDSTPQQSFPTAPLTDFQLEAQPAVLRKSGGTAQRLPEDFMVQLVQDYRSSNGTADIDISGREFNFVWSIRVFDVDWYQRVYSNSDGEECRTSRGHVRMGTYGRQGQFAWHNIGVSTAQTPDAAWFGFRTQARSPCTHAGRYRAVGVEWRDYEGNHGYEVVTY